MFPLMKLSVSALAFSALLTQSSFAGQLHVPGDHATLQGAIDAASAGDVIVVAGGVHPPITIDRPLTIVGEDGDRPTIRYHTGPEKPGPSCGQQPAIRLAGSGAGVVVLASLDIEGHTDGFFYCEAGSAARARVDDDDRAR
jgi:hypothetical protein